MIRTLVRRHAKLNSFGRSLSAFFLGVIDQSVDTQPIDPIAFLFQLRSMIIDNVKAGNFTAVCNGVVKATNPRLAQLDEENVPDFNVGKSVIRAA